MVTKWTNSNRKIGQIQGKSLERPLYFLGLMHFCNQTYFRNLLFHSYLRNHRIFLEIFTTKDK